MVCRDFLLRICTRNPCNLSHKIEKCTRARCNKSNLCKRVHLTDDEVIEINCNIRPFRENVFQEMKRLAYVLRQSFPKDLQIHTCTLKVVGQCLWPCIACNTNSTKCTFLHNICLVST